MDTYNEIPQWLPYELQEAIEQLERFRQDLYQHFPNRADTLMDLVDALAGNTTARSPVELSLSPLFRREYSSIYDGIKNLFVGSGPEKATDERREEEQQLVRLIAARLPQPHKYWLFGTDVTPIPRRFAETMPDRQYVHQPNTLAGNIPVTIGHDCSVLAAMPEKGQPSDPPWVVPLVLRRVTPEETASQVGADQIRVVVTDESLPFHKALCVSTVDSGYSGIPYLGQVMVLDNLVTVVRLPGNRVVYGQPQPIEKDARRAGHPTWYGERFALKDAATWKEPDEAVQTTFTSRSGRIYTVELQGWHNQLRKGTREVPMYNSPFTLVRARVLDETGKSIHKHAMWLLVIGKRRGELSLIETWKAYSRRYDMEHFFRFGKQRLLLVDFQTPQLEREENWWQIVQLAYISLWLSCSMAKHLPNPWERYLPSPKNGVASPSVVQRDYMRIISLIGSPADAPKRRGNSHGRRWGTRLLPRKRFPVVKKTPKQPAQPTAT